jgi:hypothetical protein
MTIETISSELQTQATCPNCWASFNVEDVNWVAAHDSIIGDPRLGPDAPQRFLPTHFDLAGNAIDIRGMSCQDIACPACHLRIPRSTLYYRPFFVSIAGTPSCGKSFFLASMSWQLRKILPREFLVTFSDADGECNKILNDYEEQLFFSPEAGRLVKLAKTDVVGDWYSTVHYENQSVTYPKPFYFDAVPLEGHFREEKRKQISRMVCLYDNAGESFLPGSDTVNAPVTRHLGLAEAWLYCFDPTQDPRARAALDGKSADVQVTDKLVTARQDTVLNEMVNRIRRHSNLGLKEKTDKPLIVVCTKFDAWSSLLAEPELKAAWSRAASLAQSVVNLTYIQKVSEAVRGLFEKICPEVVAVSRSISNNVYFVPVSATGTAPVKDPQTGKYMMRTDMLQPQWCEVPMLLALSLRAPSLVVAGQAK